MPNILKNAPVLPIYTGLVVSAGLMSKTVKVRLTRRVFDKKIRKFYRRPENVLTHDPNSSLREGDVVEISPGWRASSQVRHVVTKIVAPFGPPIGERPPVPTAEQRKHERERRLEEKRIRKGKIVHEKRTGTMDGGVRVRERVERVGVERAVREWEARHGRKWEGGLPEGVRERLDRGVGEMEMEEGVAEAVPAIEKIEVDEELVETAERGESQPTSKVEVEEVETLEDASPSAAPESKEKKQKGWLGGFLDRK